MPNSNRRRRRSTLVRAPHLPIENAGTAISATNVKNKFGSVLDQAIQGATFVITKHDSAKAVLMSIDEFNRLSRAGQAALAALTSEFDHLLAAMQTPAARSAMDSAFQASPKELGRAARAAARKRG